MSSQENNPPFQLEVLIKGGFLGKRPTEKAYTVTTMPPYQRLKEAFTTPITSFSEGLVPFAELCLLLDFLHRQGVVHRDLRPDNIYVAEGGRALLLGGFGAAKFLGEASPVFIGTPGYACPELLQNRQEHFDPTTDLFSFGAILYEHITGRNPFEAPSRAAILLATLRRDPAPLRELSPGCPPYLEALCLRLLSKAPADRPASAQEVLEEILGNISEQKRSPISAGGAPSNPLEKELGSATTLSRGLVELGSATTLGHRTPSSPGSVPGSQDPTLSQNLPASFSPPPTAGLELPMVSASQYEVMGELGRGGLGKVMRAKDKRLGRQVAVKELLRNVGHARERFLREAFITAKLQHPSIVPIYEAGVWPSGEPFYAMKLVSGEPLDQLLKEAKTLPARLAFLPHLISVCEAIAYAHSQKIIHRDLKPQNILVGEFGETVVIDWGLAKELNTPDLPNPEEPFRSVETGGLTQAGEIMGTPAYMPLEQAQGKQVDARADVYSLGAILYFLLSGRSPYKGKRSIEVIKALLQDAPRTVESIEPNAPKELLAILKKAMARTISERYPSAKELAEDLKRFQAGQLVAAHQYSSGERLLRFLRKHRRVFMTALVFFILLLVGGVYSYIINSQALRETQEANEKASIAQASERKTSMERLLQLARFATKTNPTEALGYLKTLAVSYPEFSEWGRARAIAATAIASGVPTVLGGVSWAASPGHSNNVSAIAFSPDGTLLASGGLDNTVRLWDLSTNTDQLLGSHDDVVQRVKFSPDGALLASSGFVDGKIRLWDVRSGKLLHLLEGHTYNIFDTQFSPDGKLLASCSFDNTVRLWDVETGEQLEVMSAHTKEVWSLAFSPDGRFLASTSKDKTVRLWNVESGEQRVFSDYEGAPNVVSFSPMGDLLITASFSDEIKLWDTTTGELRASLVGSRVVISPSGKFMLAIVNGENSYQTNVLLWDTYTGQLLSTFKGPERYIERAIFSPDEELIAAASQDGAAYLWERTTGAQWVLPAHEPQRLLFSPDGRTLASSAKEPSILLWDIESIRGRILYAPEAPDPANPQPGLVALSASSELSRVVLASSDGAVRLRDLSSQQEQRLVGSFVIGQDDEATVDILFSPDDTKIAAIGEGKVRVWDVARGESLDLVEGYHPTCIVFSSDSKVLAVGGKDHKIQLFDVKTGALLSTLVGHKDYINGLAFSPDDTTLASTSQDHAVRLWELATGQSKVIEQIKFRYWLVRFSSDGSSLFLALGGPTQRIDVSTLQAIDEFAGPHPAEIALSSGGQFVAGALAGRGGLSLWDLVTTERAVLNPGKGFQKVWFTSSGLVGLTGGFQLVLFPAALPEHAAELPGWFAELPFLLAN